MTHYFIAPDAHNVPTLWRENGDLPQPVATRHQYRDDPEVWAALVKLGARDGSAADFSWSPDAHPCPPLSFTGGRCANTEPLPHPCYGATAYVPDAHDKSEANQ